MTIEKCTKCNRRYKIDSFVHPDTGEEEIIVSCRCNQDYLTSVEKQKQNKKQNTTLENRKI